MAASNATAEDGRRRDTPRAKHRRGRLLRAVLLALVIAALGATALAALAFAQGVAWATYTNPRFGTTADYPADLFTVRDPPPANGDGQSFHTADGRAQLLIYGARNAANDTPRSYLENYVDLSDAIVAYRQTTARLYAISGTRGDNIFYERCNFAPVPEGVIDCVHLTYPAAQKAQWDRIVARLAASQRAGQGVEPRR